jgi:hypothetical protein
VEERRKLDLANSNRLRETRHEGSLGGTIWPHFTCHSHKDGGRRHSSLQCKQLCTSGLILCHFILFGSFMFGTTFHHTLCMCHHRVPLAASAQNNTICRNVEISQNNFFFQTIFFCKENNKSFKMVLISYFKHGIFDVS